MTSYQIQSIKEPASFESVHELMRALLQKRIDDEIEDTIIICEHTPVITRGRGLQWREDRKERAKPLMRIPDGTDYVEIERGGDLTWHGPGQLVIYPVVKLGGSGRIGSMIGQDVDRYVRFLENLWVNALKPFGIETATRPGGSGVWIQDRKLASVGIALRRWVTYHGVAMNIVNCLDAFHAFSPCGFNAEVMTRLSDLPGLDAGHFSQDWRAHWESLLLKTLDQMLLSTP